MPGPELRKASALRRLCRCGQNSYLSKFTRHDVIVDHSRETGGGAMSLGLPLGIDLSCVCVYVCTCVRVYATTFT